MERVRRFLFESSLSLFFLVLFLSALAGQSMAGHGAFNEEQREHGQAAISWAGYLTEHEFWETTLQNWQSEFLAVGTMAAFSIYLRQRGSPESKPVGAPHDDTSSSG
jgi:hypothetical protein